MCNAYFSHPGSTLPIFYSDHALYVLTETESLSATGNGNYECTLVRMNEDGTNRTELFSIPTAGKNMIYDACIHRGVFYYILGGYGGEKTRVYARPLNQKSGESELLHEPTEEKTSYNAFNGILAYGNRLYLHEYLTDQFLTVRIIDLNTRESTQVTLPDGMKGVGSYPFIQDGKLMLPCYEQSELGLSEQDVPPYTVYSFDLDGTNPQRIGELPRETIFADGQYIYHNTRRGEPSTESRTLDRVFVYDAELNEIGSVAYADITGSEMTSNIAGMIALAEGETLLQLRCKGDVMLYYSISQEELASGVIKMQELIRYNRREYQ